MPPVSPPTRPALRARYERRRREVVATAAHLFAERGYSETSVGDLTAATGLAAGGLYHYIGSKEALLLSICDELLEPLLPRAREIAAAPGPAEQRLRELMRVWLEHIQAHLDHMLVFAQERHVLERDPQWAHLRRRRKEFEQILDALLARGEAEGAMSFADRGMTLLALLGMVNYTPQWLRPGGRLGAAEIADHYCDLILS
jgi:AcrR family transcriptional regulator